MKFSDIAEQVTADVLGVSGNEEIESFFPWLADSAWEREGAGGVKERKTALELNRQGHHLLTIGKAEAALRVWENAEALYRAEDNIIGAIGSQINQARALETIGDYRKSCDLLLSAFGSDSRCDNLTIDDDKDNKDNQIDKVIFDLPTEYNPIKFPSLQNLGNVLRRLGKLEESLQVLKTSLEVAEILRSQQDRRSQEYITYAYISLGNTARDLAQRAKVRGEVSNYQEALDYYQNAIESATSGELRLQAAINKLSLLIENPQQHLEEIQKLRQDIFNTIQNLSRSENSISRELVAAQINYGTTLRILKDNLNNSNGSGEMAVSSEMTEILKNAVQQAQRLVDLRLLSHAKGLLGEVSDDEIMILEALKIAQKISAGDIAYRWQWQLGRLQKDKKNFREAIGYYQAAFNTLQGLRGDLVAFDRDIQFNFRKDVEPVYRELVELLLRNGKPSQENLKQARDVIEGLQLAELDNFFREACTNVKIENLDNVIDQADTPTAAIYMILIEERLEIIIKLSEKKELLYYKKNFPSNIGERIKDARKAIEGITSPQIFLEFLYKQLIGFYERDLANNGIKTLGRVIS